MEIYYRDLSKYHYVKNENSKNIGWLSLDIGFYVITETCDYFNKDIEKTEKRERTIIKYE